VACVALSGAKLLEICAPVRSAQPGDGDELGVDRLDVEVGDPASTEPLADIGDVAVEELECIGVGRELDCLRQVDDHEPPAPPQHVVRREVRVDQPGHGQRDEAGLELPPRGRELIGAQPGLYELRRRLLVVDNASWHKSKSLRFGAFEPTYLPPYSPDFNPIERLWLILKAEWFTDFVAKDRAALIARLDAALCWLIDRTELNKSTAAIR